MPIPDLIPISYEPDFHTDTIGTHAGGLFFGGVCRGWPVAAYEEVGEWPWRDEHGEPMPGPWFAILHLFDHDGRHLSSEIGPFADGAEADQALQRMLACLQDVEYGDIAVRLFRVDAHDCVFGLIDETDRAEDGDGYVEYYPNQIGFYEPWDGSYDT
ncbi:hypothetical protein [Microbispora catharanthi]|uniref:Uncharacterized protein n=1 Tax=Microbispora catharanthi TaxID=1712871 RepID=A0A5N6BZP0_9ACTN|nr:hypothetical protein [Microbispora catharanthi]KAB8185968.1 hypothetical protein FH610_009405 [Microbispora catharanthi]